MFTGIIEEIGTLLSLKQKPLSSSLRIAAKTILNDIHLGDSICVNGVCLTVTSFQKDYFTADVMGETLRRSNLGSLKQGSRVNLERALSLSSRLGGHMVSGHIDGTGTIIQIWNESTAHWFKIQANHNLLRYIVEKGSIAIDGISLTVASVDDTSFQVSIIPHTSVYTTLLDKQNGEIVNLECDLIGKYVEKLIYHNGEQTHSQTSNLSKDFLAQHGYLP